MTALKLFAAMDQGPRSVHMQDLLRLAPQDASGAFHAQIPQALEHVGNHRGFTR
ncbi:MAG TPA: hypothetical protein VF613_17575 [Longimicrobium sp.]|jgi:hypothetical protein